LCAIDLGPDSQAVLNWAAGFAREYGAELTVVHAIPRSTINLGGLYFDPEWTVQVRNEARDRAAFLLDEVGVKADIVINIGEPAEAVRLAAEETGAGILVIGRGRHAGVLGRLRANAYAILRDSPCPVAAI